MSLLAVRGLGCGYGGAPVLHEVNLRVEAAQLVAVLGGNGAGKSTLLRALSGLLPLSAGAITFAGRDLAAVAVEDRVRLGIGHVPQGRGVVEELSVAENLRLGALWRRSDHVTARVLADVYDLFEPLAQRRAMPAHRLSGGERQMLAIGRALMGGPRLLLLDEPSVGLAPALAVRLLELLRGLCDNHGLAILLAEHQSGAALAIADSALVLAHGRVARG